MIEQAKGVLAEHGTVSMDEAFARLRSYARAHHLGLTGLAAQSPEAPPISPRS
ncbi:MAG TPA: ANTAR domain-containing protein [Streptomyces sp.]